MKKTTLVIITAMLALVSTTQAQQKIGHVNSADVLQAMPEFKQMQDDIQKQKDSYTKLLQGMYEDYDKKQKALKDLYDQKAADLIIENAANELQQLQQRISEFENKVNDDLQKMQSDKLEPIKDKYLKAVKDVAVANGYSYIIDVASGAIAYFPEEAGDITDLVMKKLGIIKAPAPAGGTGTTPSKTGTTAPK